MATNVEIKARVRDMQAIRAIAEKLSDRPGALFVQEDTFFHTPQGRLKLRVVAPDEGQLIYYERADAAGPKPSDYFVAATADPAALKAVLAPCLGVRGVVRKQRTLYWVGNTRIHLDEVEGLGSFVELEVMLGPGQSEEEGEAIARELMSRLGVEESDLVEGAYMDLLEGNRGNLVSDPARRDNMNQQYRGSGTPFAIWEIAGTTEHLGGVSATRHLLELCHIVPGQTVLDVGCGTGYTACYLAQHYGARVLAADVRLQSLEQTMSRFSRATLQGVRPAGAEGAGQVTLLRADAHHLPCSAGVADVVVGESVLVFCDAPMVAAEFWRVLKPGGICALNELTLLAPPPPELTALLEKLGIRCYQSHEWQSILVSAGLVDVSATVRRMSFWEQLSSHLQADGLRGYMRAMRKGLANAEISRTFINRAMLGAARKFVPLIGYGLYVGQKPL